MALFLLTADGELAPEVYAAATSLEQAGQVFEEAKVVAERAESLRKMTERLTRLIRCKKNNGIFRVLSKMAETSHGLNVSGAVIDEIHLHKKKDLIEAMETGTGRSRAAVAGVHHHRGRRGPHHPVRAEARLRHAGVQGRVRGPELLVGHLGRTRGRRPVHRGDVGAGEPELPDDPAPEYMEREALRAQRDPSFLADVPAAAPEHQDATSSRSLGAVQRRGARAPAWS